MGFLSVFEQVQQPVSLAVAWRSISGKLTSIGRTVFAKSCTLSVALWLPSPFITEIFQLSSFPVKFVAMWPLMVRSVAIVQ